MSRKEDLVGQLKKLSRVQGKEGTWISSLSDDRLYEVYFKLRSGESSRSIARHVQQSCHINPSSTIHSVAQGVTKFRRRISHLLMIPPHVGNDPIGSNPYLELNEETTLERMERMSQDIEARINRMMKEEQETGIQFPHLNRDITALAALRKSIVKQRDWELIHGDSVEAQKYKAMEERIKRRFDGFLDYLGDDGQKRLITAMDRFLELVEKHAVKAVLNDEGKYVLIEEDPAIRQADNLKNNVK